MRIAFFILFWAWLAQAAPEIHPVASYFQFEVRSEPFSVQPWELWVIRPQLWDDGIPREVEILTSAGRNGDEVAPLSATHEQRLELFATNRVLAQTLLRNVYEFRLKSVLRDYRVKAVTDLPAAIREELESIKSGKRAFAVLQRPGGFDPNLIELTVGVAYDEPGGLLTENRLKGRALLEHGLVYGGLAPIPPGPQRFVDRDFSELGKTSAVAKLTPRTYAAGARAELTTFAKSEHAAFDLVPAIHRFLVTLGLTRFGLRPVEPASDQYRRISRLSVEAVGYPGGKNPLSAMYQRWMGFEVSHHIPRDPDFPSSSTDILEMPAENFENELMDRLAQRPGQALLDKGEIFPKYIHYGTAYQNGVELPPVFFLQPSHERRAKKEFPSCAEAISNRQ